MAKENDIKEELLKQMDKNSDANAKSTQEILTRDMARVRRMKWVTMFTWLLVAILVIVIALMEHSLAYLDYPDTTLKATASIVLPTLKVILRPLVFLAIFFTIALYIRSRTLSIKQIHARLSNIEEQLKKMSEEK